jgi:hypothetical protein
MKHVPFEHWNSRSNQNKDIDPEAQLKKELGMPTRLSVSPHFYYKSALWHCNQAINAVVNTETGEEDRGHFIWRKEFNDPKYDDDISKCQVQDNLLPDNIKQLRDTYSNVYEDYKTALYYLALQRRETKYYEARRSNFYHICIVMNGKRPTHTFSGKELHVQMKKAFASDKRQSRSIETPVFTRLFDEAYRNHYTNIKVEIERFAAHRTPLEYTQRHTPDITNLHYYLCSLDS